MVTKLTKLFIALLVIGSCSLRKPIDNFDLEYQNNNVSVAVTITHKKKMENYIEKDQYFYYGEMQLEVLKSNTKESDIPYLIAVYDNQKSDFEFDSIADYGNFWSHLVFDKKINKYKIYIHFSGKNVDTSKIFLKEVDKKFKYLPLNFYDKSVSF